MNPPRSLRAALFAFAFSSSAVAASSADAWGYRPLRVIQTSEANFPPVLLAEGVTTGQVRAVLNIDAEGTLADCLVIGYTRPELLSDFQAVLREWRYEPARERGEPIGVRKEFVFSYEARGAVLSVALTDSSNSFNRMFPAEFTSLLCKLGELDRPLATVQVVRPAHPGARLRPAQGSGTAAIDFYVDREGRPRMPVVVRASHEAFGAAAADALVQWRFVPPTREGKPVAVRVRQDFVFSPRS